MVKVEKLQQHGNWEPTKFFALISHKHVEQIVQRELIDPHMHMVPFVQRWENIVNELQKKIKSKFPRNHTMCKDTWNALNLDYKKHTNYHKGTKMHTYFWDLMSKEKERFHLPCVFNRDYYESIDVFQG